MAIESALDELRISYKKVELGQVEISDTLSEAAHKRFEEKIKSLGFELLDPGKSSLISKIKTLIIQQIHYAKTPLIVNFSAFLADEIHLQYAYMSRLFSSVEGITIEKYITRQRIEKAKELLCYNEMTVSEIADKMGYGSVAHLSSQFKKETGMTPTQFKTQKHPNRQRSSIT